LLGRSVGNVLFTAQGLSGPGAMDLSHLVSLHLGELLTLGIDFLAAHRQAFLAFLDRKRYDPLPIRILLGAVMPVKVPPVLLGLAGIDSDLPLASLQDATLEALLALLTDVRVPVKGTRGFQFAQLSTGGVPLAEIDPHTMASCRVPGLYLAGEVLNVIGPCGGYNLQFAWASGMLAGRSAAL